MVASHHKGAASSPDDSTHQITWLEVIEFARSHPGQFTLSTFSEGKRVCQFYYPQKQLRVQISEEDFLFINSGRCQELIPPLPIWEDEEKEVGTCDVLEAKLKELTNAADMVAARTRQLSHRLKLRRAAILDRRAEGGSGTPAKASAPQTTTAPPTSSGSGFTAVNSANGKSAATGESSEPALGSNAAVRNELLRHFESLAHNQSPGQGRSQSRHHSIVAAPDPSSQPMKDTESIRDNGTADSTASSLSPVPPNAFPTDNLSYYISDGPSATQQATNSVHRPSLSTGSHTYTTSHTPLKHNFSRPLPPALESSQPFRPLCQAHMDSLPRGQRVLPPCDRCRRLRMDCVKNLTSCAGCTKKHARCHWRDVSRDELGALDHLMESAYSANASSPTNANAPQTNGYIYGNVDGAASERSDHGDAESDDDDSNPLEDLEALGEKEERENEAAAERLKEDEEGLRNAKELARQGWEESLRATQQSHDATTKTQDEGRVEHDAGEIRNVVDASESIALANGEAMDNPDPIATANGEGVGSAESIVVADGGGVGPSESIMVANGEGAGSPASILVPNDKGENGEVVGTTEAVALANGEGDTTKKRSNDAEENITVVASDDGGQEHRPHWTSFQAINESKEALNPGSGSINNTSWRAA